VHRRVMRALLIVVTAGATLTTLGMTAPNTAGGATRAAPSIPTLTAVRAAHHPGYDRLVFEFRGRVPAHRGAAYVKKVVAPSGRTVHIVGSAILAVHFRPATSFGGTGMLRRTYALPNIIQVVTAEDFESYMTIGVGLARREPFHLFTLTKPSRIVVDVRTPFHTVRVHDYFLDSNRFKTGQEPFTRAVHRPVIPPATAFGALQRLFAGPTMSEWAHSLRFVSSKATGFKNLRIRDGVARVQLTGRCSSGGSTFSIANEIRPTLKQFSSVNWVKIYSPSGDTEHPWGHTDSIPGCLEP
jgi:Sporulation and spore germination